MSVQDEPPAVVYCMVTDSTPAPPSVEVALSDTVPFRKVPGLARVTVGPVLSTVTLVKFELAEFVALSVAVIVYCLLPADSDALAVCSALM
jgi:hypothetical protein